MGKIVLFFEEGCSQSRRTEATLIHYNLPYSAINVTQYPKKRADLVSLCMRRQTPQVFFNTRHVGGAEETIALLKKWDKQGIGERSGPLTSGEFSAEFTICSKESKKSTGTCSRTSKQSSKIRRDEVGDTYMFERYMAEVGQHNDPVDARLALPDAPPESTCHRMPRAVGAEYCIQLPGNDTSTVLEMTEMLKDIINHTVDNTVDRVVYKRSIFGHQITKALQSVFCTSSDETRLFAEQLLRYGVFRALQGDCGAAVFDDTRLFRLQCHDTPEILNSYRVWTEDTDRDIMGLINGWCDMLQTVEASVMDDNGFIDAKKAAKHPRFAVFEEAVCELQGINMDETDDTLKLAFGLNVYNLMIKYAQIKHGIVPLDNATGMTRSTFYSCLFFYIGDHLYSFNDWEHGILRGNAKPPNSLLALLSRTDPRYRYVVNTPDPRIHFCLNRGTRGCPPVLRYSERHLDTELSLAAIYFCEDNSNVRVDRVTNTVQLSQIFRIYRSDFTINEAHLPQLIVDYMKGNEKREILTRVINDSIKVVKIMYGFNGSKRISYLRGPHFDSTTLSNEEVKGINRFLYSNSSRKSPKRSYSSQNPKLLRSPSSVTTSTSSRSLDF